jgi:hypothetical protein
MLSRDDIIRIMRNLLGPQSESWDVDHAKLNEFMPLFEAIAASEREACAKVCESQITGSDFQFLATRGHWDHMAQAATNCAAAIRARGNK